ncbi:MAG: peptidase [Desulfobacterales bacterium CG23_combo_of_CG06-09_8_20_14_all_51_8]|nr:MAG: peptidase [Desulfobacterales bacterium CG23_combo_of_CG06-09_8_20_14_all_51_8]
MGFPFSWEQFDDPEQSEKYLCHRLDEGKPALLRTDIYHLPYYRSNTHFPGHLITAWGYDRKEKLFFVTDTERKDHWAVPFDKMCLARYSNGGFINMKGDMFAPDSIEFSGDFPQIIKTAIIRNSMALTDTSHDYYGLNALYKMKKEMRDWPEIEDWKWIARFTYQVIEKRGTGGCGFRLMYHDFLKQASQFVSEIAESGLAQMMIEAGLAWRDLATALKEASEEDGPDVRPGKVV